jgi:SAM-dependent methyltransferase
LKFKLKLSEDNPNTLSNIEEAFSPGGPWDKNCGQSQTRIFTECLLKHVRIPFGNHFSVLDVGCALGDGLAVWHRRYPNAKLFGCDVSQTAIDRATQMYGTIATFTRSSFEEITGTYDVIICSNVLEHFEQHVEIARELLSHCKMLYIMTPYAELNNGKPLVPSKDSFHVATFLEDTFSSLEQGCHVKISTKIVRCPGAWSPSLISEAKWHVLYLLGVITSPAVPRRQIIYSISK